MSAKKVRVAILDDHQSIIDGYVYRLNQTPGVEVVASAVYGEDLEPMLAETEVDVLLLDLSVRTSEENPNPFPILYEIPKILQRHSALAILVISMFIEPGLTRALVEAGASGYMLKDDTGAFRDLGNVVLSIAHGGIYLSRRVHDAYLHTGAAANGTRLTPRQLELLSLCAAYPDLSTADLARKMSVSNSTVRNLLSSAYLRLGVHSRTAAVEKARELGFITPRPPALGE